MRRLAVLLCAVSLPAAAYNEAIHALLTRRAFADRAAWLAEPLAPPTQADLDAFRALFWRTAAQLPDPALRAKFLARWPSEQAFTAWELKQLFLLDPAAAVHGFDLVDAGRMARGDVLAAASRWPDDDERNRHRYLRGADHGIVRAPDGSPVPYDPATLDFGSLTGTTSQGHAHYGLVTEPLSDDPAVLKKEPWRFAVPPTAHAYGAELAQLYTDLSLLAAGSGLASREWLVACFAGAAFHHLEDVGNQIHTVQVGIYELFRDAWLQSKLRDLRTLGGLLGERRSLRQIGLRLIANHHLFSEDLFAKRVLAGAPEVRAAIDGLSGDDAGLAARVPPVADFGQSIAQAARSTGWRTGSPRPPCATAWGTSTTARKATIPTGTCAPTRAPWLRSTSWKRGACAAPRRRCGSGKPASTRRARRLRQRRPCSAAWPCCCPITRPPLPAAPPTSLPRRNGRASPGAIPPPPSRLPVSSV